MKFLKLFSIVIIFVFLMSGCAYAYRDYKPHFPREKHCTITNDRGVVWIRVLDVDKASTTLNDGWPIYQGTMYSSNSFTVDNTYGRISIHYQRQKADRGYGMFDLTCDGNTIRIPQ